MRAWKCWRQVWFNGSDTCPDHEALFGLCTDKSKPEDIKECNLKSVEITPLAEYEAQRKAIEKADLLLEIFDEMIFKLQLPLDWDDCEGRSISLPNWIKKCRAALAELRAVNEVNKEAEGNGKR